jgi:hypothetical protein
MTLAFAGVETMVSVSLSVAMGEHSENETVTV